MSIKSEDVKILLVDDDSIDRKSVIQAFRRENFSNEFIEAKHGEDALGFLRGQNGKDKVDQPYIILLDLNMPVMNGLEFLQELRSDPELDESMVFMLTSSNDSQDYHKAYKQHVSGYLLKGQDKESLTKKVKMLHLFMGNVEFPMKTSGNQEV